MTAISPISGQAITLANSIIGVGILAMPFCFKQCGIILSTLLLIGSSTVSRLSCHFLLKSAIYSRRDNFESLAYYVFGSAGKFAAEIGIIGFLMGTCVAYFVVVGDLGPQIIAKMFNLNQSDFLRTCVMVVVSLVCVLPLGLLRNVDSLSNVCAATIGFYFCLVLKILAEATNPLISGEWTSKVEYWRPEGVLQCLPIFSMALCCQTQLFEIIYDTLPNATLDKMNCVIKNAVNICTVVYILVGLFGYIAFCHMPISGNILVNFSPTMGSDVIQVGFVMALAFSFPLIIFPCRASLYSLLYRKGQTHNQELINNLIPKLKFKCLTISIIVVTLIVGLLLPNIELVLGLVGSTIGIMICVIFPSTCFICISVKNTNERILAQIVLCCGIIIMVLGTYANLQAVEMDNIGLEAKIAIELDKYSSNDNKINKITPVKQLGNDLRNVIGEASFIKNTIEEKTDQSGLVNGKNYVSKLDSKVQPPNPVAPLEESSVKVKTTLPLSVNSKLDTFNKDEKVEGAGDKEVQVESVNVKLEEILNVPTNPPEVKHKGKEEKNTEREEALMKTIKKHVEVQRQMVEEQKEILEEIKEMKKDIESKQKEESMKTKVSNKEAVENIKKLAQAAIDSLQEAAVKSTDKPVIKQDIKDIENSKPIEPVHVHKQDEPESYKAGEDIEILKKNVENTNTDKVIPKVTSLSQGVPIAIALSKGTKVDGGKNMENEVLKEAVIEVVQTEKNIERKETLSEGDKLIPNQLNKDKEETKPDIKVKAGGSQDYIAGKRDILQINTERTTLPNPELKFPRNKRDTSDTISCTKNQLESDDTIISPNTNVLEANSLQFTEKR